MSSFIRCTAALLAPALFVSMAAAQTTPPAPQPPTGPVHLNVVVTPKSGSPVAGLPQSAFTLLDNKVPRPIQSFREVHRGQSPTEVILLVDDVNVYYSTVSSERDQIERFLRANEGHLALPTSLAILSDTGAQIQQGSTTDGNALAADLHQAQIGMRTNRRSSGFYGAVDRYQISINTLDQLISRESTRPGRKLILWVSRGWPILSGPGITLSSSDQQKLFAQIVATNTRLRLANITLYSIDPLGPTEGVGQDFYYEGYLKGVAKPSQTDVGDLSLQVLATQTGGLVLNSNDVGRMIATCIDDTIASYDITFDPPPAETPNQYHSLAIQLSQPGLNVRTLSGYYNQP